MTTPALALMPSWAGTALQVKKEDSKLCNVVLYLTLKLLTSLKINKTYTKTTDYYIHH